MANWIFNKALQVAEILDALREIKKDNSDVLVGTKPFPILRCLHCGATCDIKGPSIFKMPYSVLERSMKSNLEISPERFIRASRNYSVNSLICCRQCHHLSINAELVILNNEPISITVEYKKRGEAEPILFPLSRAELIKLLPNPANTKKDRPPRPHLTYHLLRSNICKDKKFAVNINLYVSFDNKTAVISQCKACQHKAKINIPIKDIKRWLIISKERADHDNMPDDMPAIRFTSTGDNDSQNINSDSYHR